MKNEGFWGLGGRFGQSYGMGGELQTVGSGEIKGGD